MKQLIHSASALLIILSLYGCDSKTAFLSEQTKENISIVIMGNTFAERLQDYSFFEALLHKNFPDKQLTVRNIGWSGDEIHFQSRPLNFPEQMEILRDLKADVIIACYGMNEAFNGRDSLQIFERRLTGFLDSLQSNQFNGSSAPEILLVSPIAHEKIPGSKADRESHNESLGLYTKSMATIAGERDVSFVDLFEPTRKWNNEDRQLTINGIHLNEEGYKKVAEYLALRLNFRAATWKEEFGNWKKLVDFKNKQYYYHYRAVNSEYIRGRRKEPWVQPSGGPISYPDELGKLERMVASLDSLIWMYNNTEDQGVFDKASEILNDTTLYTKEEEGSLPITTRDQFQLQEGFDINLFASEVESSLANPVKMLFDPKGRMWVSTMQSYPQYLPGSQPNDKIIILEDTDHDGVADKETIFADSLYMPTSFEIGKNGVYVAQPPNIWFMQDTDGDGKADKKEIILHGFGTEDVHHTLTTFTWGPDGALYWHTGTFLHSQVETPYGLQRSDYGVTWRYEPETKKLDPYISYPYANAWGHVFLRNGTQVVSDVSTGMNYFAPPLTVASEFPRKLVRMKDFLTSQYKPKVCGIEVVSSGHFPEEVQGNMLFNTFVRALGVNQHQILEDSSGITAVEVEPLLKSADPNFRPVDLKFGPDGALYVVDWYNPIINHGERALRDPNRDHVHGRIWRISYQHKPTLKPIDLTEMSLDGVLDYLKAYEDRVRYRVRTLLRQKDAKDVIPAVEKWVYSLDKKDPLYDQHRLEALWVYQEFNRPNPVLLEELLASDDDHIRTAAVRVLYYWKDSIKDSEERLIALLKDPSMKVRLQAIVALSHFPTERTVRALLDAGSMPSDYYIRYAMDQTYRHLRPVWWKMLKDDDNFLENEPRQLEDLLGVFYNASILEVPAFIKNGPDWPLYAWSVLKDEELAELKNNKAVSQFLQNMKNFAGNSVYEGLSIPEIGQTMIARSDCYTCHKEKGEMVGPAFDEISKRYSEDSISYLSKKIITGGVGRWGDTPMTPHPEVGKEEAEMMVQYILSH